MKPVDWGSGHRAAGLAPTLVRALVLLSAFYTHEKQFELTQSRPGREEAVNITCRAQGIYPEPKMALLRGGSDDSTRLRRAAVLSGVAVQTLARSGAYDIVATKLLDGDELSSPTVLACELRVPATNYTRLKSLVYYPGKLNYPYSSESTEAGASRPVSHVFIASLALPLFFRLFG